MIIIGLLQKSIDYIENNAWTICDKFIFKTGKNISGLKTHIIIAKALANLGIETSYSVLTKDGEDFMIEDDKYFILTK